MRNDQEVMERPVLVTGIRVVDLICPVPRGGSLAICGDSGSGVVAVAMETMQNLCRRYEAKASCHVTTTEPFNEANVRGWVDKLNVRSCVKEFLLGDRAAISIATAALVIATLLPFAQSTHGADAWVVLRRSVLEAGRLPAVELSESGSRLADVDWIRLAQKLKAEVARGSTDLIEYLSQPFFVAEPWTSRPGEVTDREDALEHVRRLISLS